MRVYCEGRRVKFSAEKITLPNGHEMIVDKVRFPNSVSVLPYFTTGRIVLIEQYRPTIDKWILEAPAGVIEKEENPLEAAKRELKEETGLEADCLLEVASGYVSPGYSTEYMYLYIAVDPLYSQSNPEDHEIISSRVELDIEEAIALVKSHRINDIKTILLILEAARVHKEGIKIC